MAFTKKTWKDRISQYLNRRRLVDVNTNEVQTVTVSRDEGSITEAGDAFSAANMNDLESRIETGFNDLTGSGIPVSDNDTTSIADAIGAFSATQITPTISNVNAGMTVDANYRNVFDLGSFYYIAIKINITTAIGTWQQMFDIAEVSTTSAVRFFAQHQTTTDKAICYCLHNSIQSQTALSTGDWWLIVVIPKI